MAIGCRLFRYPDKSSRDAYYRYVPIQRKNKNYFILSFREVIVIKKLIFHGQHLQMPMLNL